MGEALGHARCMCARFSLMLQKGFVSRNPINHAVTMPVPAASARCGVGPRNYQSLRCPSTSSEGEGLLHLGIGKKKGVESNHL